MDLAALNAIDPRFGVGLMLVSLGIVTVQKIAEYFRGEGHDDEIVAAFIAEAERRIARRS